MLDWFKYNFANYLSIREKFEIWQLETKAVKMAGTESPKNREIFSYFVFREPYKWSVSNEFLGQSESSEKRPCTNSSRQQAVLTSESKLAFVDYTPSDS